MARLDFGTNTADMRQTPSYAIPALQAFDNFLANFTQVRTETVTTPTSYVSRVYDANNASFLITVTGNVQGNQATSYSVEAAGVILTIVGTYTLDPVTKNIVAGTTIQQRLDLAPSGISILNLTGISIVEPADLPPDSTLFSDQDTINGSSGNDYLMGYAGNDALSGRLGNDTLDGGIGTDTVDYSSATGPVIAELWQSFASNDGQGGADSLIGIENLTGSVFADILAGDANNNLLKGGAGNDSIYGAGGIDTVDYSSATSSVIADLLLSFASNDGQGGADTLVGIENLIGSGLNDLLAGDVSVNRIEGGSGNDTLKGTAGNDTLDGGIGTDTVDYSSATGPVIAELWQSFASNDGQGGADSLIGIENLTGSAFADILAGDANNNLFKGGAGNDSIYGAGGIDTVDYSSATSSVIADLLLSFASNDGQGGADTLVGIENLIGSGLNDLLAGDVSVNRIEGGSGNDTLKGTAGNDTLDGGIGTDTVDYSSATGPVIAELWQSFASNDGQGGADSLIGIENLTGSAFADILAGDANNNLFKGGAGNDSIYGAGGIDTVDYSSATSSVIADLLLSFASNDGQGGADTLVGIENLIGSGLNDLLAGDVSVNRIEGGSGNDTLKGTAGNDTLDGGIGTDTADYSNATGPVIAELWQSFASNDGQGGADSLIGIENLTGSAFADILAGDANNNLFKGGAGNDSIYGAGGIDTVDYSSATSSVIADLLLSFASNDGQGGADTLVGIENLIGSGLNDLLAGDVSVNRIEGGSGNDTLKGTAGNDTLDGGIGTDTVDYSSATGPVIAELWQSFASNDGQGGADSLIGIENLTGSVFADILAGDANNNLLKGGAGNDSIYGAGGIDTVDYSSATSSVIADLLLSFASNDGQGGADTLVGIENLIGSGLNDLLAGDVSVNRIEGGSGNDTLKGTAGNDTLDGGIGTDTVDYSSATGPVIAELWQSFASNDGQGGADSLIGIENLTGSVFADILAGDASNNFLLGGGGNDTLVGADGADTFVFGSGSGVDFINDFTNLQLDKIHLQNNLNGSGITTASQVLAATSNIGGSAVIDLGGGNTVTLVGVDLATLTTGDFVIF